MSNEADTRQESQIIPRAHHGTTLAGCQSIDINGFQRSLGDDHWFGDGVYFFDECVACALKWARDRHRNVSLGVIEARLDLGECLNLTDLEVQRLLVERRNDLIEKYENDGTRKRITDGHLINMAIERMERETDGRVDSVRGVQETLQSKEIFHGSRIQTGQQSVIAIRTLENILSHVTIYKER